VSVFVFRSRNIMVLELFAIASQSQVEPHLLHFAMISMLQCRVVSIAIRIVIGIVVNVVLDSSVVLFY